MKLGLVALLVPDYDRALDFFVRGLGWTCTADLPQGEKRWVTVRPAGGGAELLLARAVGDQRKAIGAQFAGRVGLFLSTDDIARDAARIEAAGGVFETPPRGENQDRVSVWRDEPYGRVAVWRDEPYGRVAVWRDPWGNRWDLIETP